MALLPTLGTHILEEMDVEGVTQELQSFSKAPRGRVELQHPTAPSESSLTSSIDNVRSTEPDVRSENGSVSVVSSVDAVPTGMSTSSTSWVDQFSSQGSSQVFPAPRESGASGSPRSSLGGTLSDSVLSTGSASGSSGLGPSTSPVRNPVAYTFPRFKCIYRPNGLMYSVLPQEARRSYGERSRYSVRNSPYARGTYVCLFDISIYPDIDRNLLHDTPFPLYPHSA